jgi:hypothetical protein
MLKIDLRGYGSITADWRAGWLLRLLADSSWLFPCLTV